MILDTDLSEDVSGDSSTTAEIVLGEIIRGELAPSSGDSADAYALNLAAGQIINVSGGNNTFPRVITVRDEDGNILASQTPIPRSPAFINDDFTFSSTEAQTVFVTISSTLPSPGFAGPPPGGTYGVTVTDITPVDTGINTITGTDGRDSLRGTNGDDDIFGQDGNDTLRGRDGEDVLFGGEGNDRLFGGNQDDGLFGEAGNDRLNGGNGNDFLTGGIGDDRLNGGRGEDDLFGNEGNDFIWQ